MENLFRSRRRFSVLELTENIFYWIVGSDKYCEEVSNDEEKVIAILKIWGIYKGGYAKNTIKETHNLTEQGFDKLKNKEWYGIKITISDEDGSLSWDFPA